MLGLGSGISVTGDYKWGGSRFLAFDGVDDKAVFTVDQPFITSIAGEGNIGANIGFSFWIKPTWDSSGTLGTSGFAPRKVMLFYIGAPADNHESVQGYYQLTNSAGTTQNRLWNELRATTSSNTRDNDFAVLHNNNGITGTGTGSSDHWKTDNPSGEGWVHIVMTRATGNWTQYWNGQALSMTDSDSGTLNTDNSIGRVFNIGFKDTDDSFHKFGVRDFAIFSQQLDSDNATSLYNSGNFFDVRTSGIRNLGAYYPFNENVRDIIGGHDLTLTGGTFTAL
tara:strand:- start:76 stop:915 length:840 start_codon:yes stop_codon:yes gene_type:complete